MQYSTDPRIIAGKIDHLSLSAYLSNLGWDRVPTKRAHVTVLQLKQEGKFFQVTIPKDKDLVDYNECMYETIEEVARTYGYTINHTLTRLLNPLSDILRIRIENANIKDGSLLFEDTINLYNNAKKIVTMAAMDVVKPRPIQPNRTDKQIQEFVNSCRFGQTEVGSYVVSLVCPLGSIENDCYRQYTLFGGHQSGSSPLTRKVTNKVITALTDIKQVIETNKIDNWITNWDKSAISANFIDSLNNIGLTNQDNTVEISVDYEPTCQEDMLPDRKVSIGSNFSEPLRSVASQLRAKFEPMKEEVIIGRICKMSAEADIENRKEGVITVVHIGHDGKTRNTKVLMQFEDYATACNAHHDGRHVRIITKEAGKKNEMQCCELDLI